MKHLGKVSVIPPSAARDGLRARAELGLADAKTDFMNAIWRAWSDYVWQKKNETRIA